ncbi:MAG: ABC transporter permease [Dysgonamonadaceae bacterium]|nr:ABC transporter permease [Dysgonamonadaceae bacterium]
MILFMMPIMQMLLFGFCLATEVKNTEMAVYDPSKDISTERIIRELDANQYFTLVEYLNSPVQILPEVRMLYNPQMKGAYNFVPGVIGLILMLICAMMTSISIVREKEHGIMEVLLASPVKPIYIILSKVTPYFALAIADLCVFLNLNTI